jgi:hypothetical protein
MVFVNLQSGKSGNGCKVGNIREGYCMGKGEEGKRDKGNKIRGVGGNRIMC